MDVTMVDGSQNKLHVIWMRWMEWMPLIGLDELDGLDGRNGMGESVFPHHSHLSHSSAQQHPPCSAPALGHPNEVGGLYNYGPYEAGRLDVRE